MRVRRLHANDVDQIFELSCYEFDALKEIDRAWVLEDKGKLVSVLSYFVTDGIMAIKYFKVVDPAKDCLGILSHAEKIANFTSVISVIYLFVEEHEDAELEVLRRAGFRWVDSKKLHNHTFYRMQKEI